MFVYVCDACGLRRRSKKIGILVNEDGKPCAIPSVPNEFKVGIPNVEEQKGPTYDCFGVCSEKCVAEIVERFKIGIDDVGRHDNGWSEVD